jgi:hypothetical protein
MWRAGSFPESSACETAAIAYSRSTIISMDYMAAPYGAFHFWSIGVDGHVAMAMPNGVAMMASCHVQDSWGECIGSAGVAEYTSATGATYLGWSYDYAKAEIADVHHGPAVPLSQTSETGVPDLAYYMRQQLFAAQFGYTGDIDGVLGPNSWAGTQRGLRPWGYAGPDDGAPATQTYMAMQRLAAAYGYKGDLFMRVCCSILWRVLVVKYASRLISACRSCRRHSRACTYFSAIILTLCS